MVLAALIASPAVGGEIPGLAPQLPPYLERDLEISFGNDFLGRGGTVDDFRTQEFIVSAYFADRWSMVVDYSLLTLENSNEPGRVDQLSASLGYEVLRRERADRTSKVMVGFGLRSNGDFAGDRVQNGFHRLIGSEVKMLPYSNAGATEITAWFDANHYRRLREAGNDGLLANWEHGIWFRGASMATGDAQWDSTAAALAVARSGALDIWLGLRSDWRSGYDDIVLRETASAEEDVAVTLGIRFGPVVFETVQQLANDASYGQLRLVSTGRRKAVAAEIEQRPVLDFAVSIPDVSVRVAGGFPSAIFDNGLWRESVLVGANYGEPQFTSDAGIFVQSAQLDVGLEFERPLSAATDWVSLYVSAAAGWREQRLVALEAMQETRSERSGRAVMRFAAGLRFSASGRGSGKGLAIQAGIVNLLPLSNASLAINDAIYRVQKPSVNLTLGFTASFN